MFMISIITAISGLLFTSCHCSMVGDFSGFLCYKINTIYELISMYIFLCLLTVDSNVLVHVLRTNKIKFCSLHGSRFARIFVITETARCYFYVLNLASSHRRLSQLNIGRRLKHTLNNIQIVIKIKSILTREFFNA